MSDAAINLYECTPRQIKRFTGRCMEAHLVPFIVSEPGMGKSSLVHGIAEDYDLALIDHRVSTSSPEDASGLPDFTTHYWNEPETGEQKSRRMATFAPFDIFPLEGTPLPINPKTGKPHQGWLVFLDEFNSGERMVQASLYKVILDRMIGQHKIHSNVVVVCAGNNMSDRAITEELSTAMQSRLIHFKMRLDFKEFMEDVAYKFDWDYRVCDYLNYKGIDGLHNFKPDHTDNTFRCPRTWDFAQKLIKGHEYGYAQDGTFTMYEDAPLIAGAVTGGAAADFITFCQVYKDLVSLKDVVGNPLGAPMPHDSMTRWATLSHLMKGVDTENIGYVREYVDRFPTDFKIMFWRGLLAQKPWVREHPIYIKNALAISRYLHG